MRLLFSKQISIYMLIVVIIFISVFIRYIRQANKPTIRAKKQFDIKIAQDILQAFGVDNILDISLANSRLKVTVFSIKLINTELLKQINIPTIVKGNEITLLIKDYPEEILNYIKGALK